MPPRKRVLDVRGLVCPLPLAATAREVAVAEPGTTIEVLVTDPASCESIVAWARREGHEVVAVESAGDHKKVVIRKRERGKECI